MGLYIKISLLSHYYSSSVALIVPISDKKPLIVPHHSTAPASGSTEAVTCVAWSRRYASAACGMGMAESPWRSPRCEDSRDHRAARGPLNKYGILLKWTTCPKARWLICDNIILYIYGLNFASGPYHGDIPNLSGFQVPCSTSRVKQIVPFSSPWLWEEPPYFTSYSNPPTRSRNGNMEKKTWNNIICIFFGAVCFVWVKHGKPHEQSQSDQPFNGVMLKHPECTYPIGDGLCPRADLMMFMVFHEISNENSKSSHV